MSPRATALIPDVTRALTDRLFNSATTSAVLNATRTPMMMSNRTLTTANTVDDAIATAPSATAVLNAFGIDTCCGGRSSISEAAERAHVDATTVIEALDMTRLHAASVPAAALPQAKSCDCGCR